MVFTNCCSFLIFLSLINLCQLHESIVPKQGDYPFMVFVFYNDVSMYSPDGRHHRYGVLILPQWVLSSSLRLSRMNGLITTQIYARAGSVIIEPEPIYGTTAEGEQDRQILRYYEPFEHRVGEWWLTDLSLMKLVSPFGIGPTIIPAKIVATDPANKICKVLIYKEIQMIMTSENGERHLQSRTVLTMDRSYCEKFVQYFDKRSMVCSYCYDLTNETTTDEGFCSDSAGAPLICDDDIVAILSTSSQRRVCDSPNSYHVLLQWEPFIECVLKEDCSSLSAMCSNRCKSLDVILDWRSEIYFDGADATEGSNYPRLPAHNPHNDNDKKSENEKQRNKDKNIVMRKMYRKKIMVKKMSTTAKSSSEIFKRTITHHTNNVTHGIEHYYNADKVLDRFTSAGNCANYTGDRNLNLHRVLQAMDRQSRSATVLCFFSYFVTVLYLGCICIL